MNDTVESQERYLPQLLEAVQRSAWLLDRSTRKMVWPLDGEALAARAKDANLFETLAAITERVAAEFRQLQSRGAEAQ